MANHLGKRQNLQPLPGFIATTRYLGSRNKTFNDNFRRFIESIGNGFVQLRKILYFRRPKTRPPSKLPKPGVSL